MLPVRGRKVTEQRLTPIISLWDLLTASGEPAGNSLPSRQLGFSTAAPSHAGGATQTGFIDAPGLPRRKQHSRAVVAQAHLMKAIS